MKTLLGSNLLTTLLVAVLYHFSRKNKFTHNGLREVQICAFTGSYGMSYSDKGRTYYIQCISTLMENSCSRIFTKYHPCRYFFTFEKYDSYSKSYLHMDTLESLGRGYSSLGGVVSSLIGAGLLLVGNNIRINDPQNSDKGKQMMVAGVAVAGVGIGIWYLAKTNKDIAAVEGMWLIALVAGTIIGALKGHDGIQMNLK